MHHFVGPEAEGKDGWRAVQAQCHASVRTVFCLEVTMFFVFGMNGLLTEKRAV